MLNVVVVVSRGEVTIGQLEFKFCQPHDVLRHLVHRREPDVIRVVQIADEAQNLNDEQVQ